MRKGNDPQVLMDGDDIVAIATGADFTAEHEQGTQALQSALCGGEASKPGFLARVLGAPHTLSTDSELIAALRAGKTVKYPELLTRKALNKDLERLEFKRSTGDTPEAVLGLCRYGAVRLDDSELGIRNKERPWAGAWDDASFAFKVAGEPWVSRLERFYQALQAGDGVFAGTFLDKQNTGVRLSGVTIALRSRLTPSQLSAVAAAQAEWEASLRLKARSRVAELQKKGKLPGVVWPVWKNRQVDTEVLYALNPAYGVSAPYYGPYTFEQLSDWIAADKKPALVPVSQET